MSEGFLLPVKSCKNQLQSFLFLAKSRGDIWGSYHHTEAFSFPNILCRTIYVLRTYYINKEGGGSIVEVSLARTYSSLYVI